MKFSNEDKEVKEFSDNYFAFGVHYVKIVLFELFGTGKDEKEYIEVTICDPKDGEKTDKARLYFVGGATNISFNELRRIAVHNAADDKKDVAGQAIDACETTQALVELLNEKVIGGDCWFTKYYDPKRTYQNKQGETKRSVNKNVLGYEPKERTDLMPNKQSADDRDEKVEDFPIAGATKAKGEAAANIPGDDDWAK